MTKRQAFEILNAACSDAGGLSSLTPVEAVEALEVGGFFRGPILACSKATAFEILKATFPMAASSGRNQRAAGAKLLEALAAANAFQDEETRPMAAGTKARAEEILKKDLFVTPGSRVAAIWSLDRAGFFMSEETAAEIRVVADEIRDADRSTAYGANEWHHLARRLATACRKAGLVGGGK